MSNGNFEKSNSMTFGKVVLGSQTTRLDFPAAADIVEAEDSILTLKNTIANLKQELASESQNSQKLKQTFAQCQQELESARAMIADMQSTMDGLKREAELRGYEEGTAKSAAELQGALATQADIWQRSIDQLFNQHEKVCEKLKSQIDDIVMAAVAKIIGDQLTTPEAIKLGIDHIVRESGELQALKIYVAPVHYEQLIASGIERLRSIRGCEVTVYPDIRVEYGGCILESSNGLTDGRYEVQLAKLRELIDASASELLK